MSNYSLIYLLFTINLLSSSTFAQNCDTLNCKPPESNFIYRTNPASTTFSLLPGSKKQVSLQLISGMDYRIFVCSSETTDIIKLKLLKEDETALYSNEQFRFKPLVEFSNKVSREVLIEIQLPDILENGNNESCIGLTIEEMKTPVIGF